MKNQQTTCTKFATMMSSAAEKTSALKTNAVSNSTLKRSILSIICFGMLLIGTTSCSRNIGSGCGTWPVVKPNNGQYRSDTWPVKAKNNQFANYKRYN